MTPERIRFIAYAILNGDILPREAIARELKQHADELEAQQAIKLREPGTVFGDLERQAKERR